MRKSMCMPNDSRGQVSFEYLMLLGLAMLLVVPSFYLFYIHTQESTEQITTSRMDRVGNELVKQAKTIYYTGRYAKTSIEFDMPTNVRRVNVTNDNELKVTIAIKGENHSLVYFAEIPMKLGNCTHDFSFNDTFYNEGKKTVIIESCGPEVALRSR